MIPFISSSLGTGQKASRGCVISVVLVLGPAGGCTAPPSFDVLFSSHRAFGKKDVSVMGDILH